MTARGRFVTIHGIDGTGKSSAVQDVTKKLRGEDFSCIPFEELEKTIRDPFKRIRTEEELDPQGELFCTLGSKALQATAIDEALDSGIWVVKDRWVIDVFADREHKGVSLPKNVGILQPDVAILLVCEDETRLQRIERRGDPTPQDLIPNEPGTRAHFFEQYLFANLDGFSGASIVMDTTQLSKQETANAIMSRLQAVGVAL